MRFYRISFSPPPEVEEQGPVFCVVQESSREAALVVARSALARLYRVALDSLRWLETSEDGMSYLDFLIPDPEARSVWV